MRPKRRGLPSNSKVAWVEEAAANGPIQGIPRDPKLAPGQNFRLQTGKRVDTRRFDSYQFAPHLRVAGTELRFPAGDCGNQSLSSSQDDGKWKQAVPGVAHIAQLVEHVLGKDEVTGSSPVVGSIGAAIVKFIEGRQR